jgi:hypothetical protein
VCVARQILDNHQFQLAQLLVGLPVVLRESLAAVVARHLSVEQSLHIGEQHFLLILHVLLYFLSIFVVKMQDKRTEAVALIDSLFQSAADIRQLEVEVIRMTGRKIVHQRRYRKLAVIIKIRLAVNGKVYNGKKRIGIHPVIVARLAHGLVAKPKIDAKTSKRLQQVVIVFDERDHFIVSLIYFMILHPVTIFC